jgi:hydroxylaminobenzene mutase
MTRYRVAFDCRQPGASVNTKESAMRNHSGRLVRQGITLFLVGLLTGLLVQAMVNPRAGLSGHLEGVMNGTFLIAVGAAWRQLRLGDRAASAVYALLVFGTQRTSQDSAR